MKLYRSNRDKKVTGLCGGLAEEFKIDATLLRLIVVISTVFSGGAVAFLYFLAALVIPKESESYGSPHQYGQTMGGWNYGQPSSTGPAPGGFHAQTAPRQDRTEGSSLDDMMKDIERKALLKEIEDLKARLAEIEKNQANNHNEKNEKGEE